MERTPMIEGNPVHAGRASGGAADARFVDAPAAVHAALQSPAAA
jgi:hypothetical protein